MSSLNHPRISTLHPYRPSSELLTFRMVRETSPSSSRPSSWYLLEALLPSFTFCPSVEMSWSPHWLNGKFPRPQHTDSTPWCLASYWQGRVAFWPVRTTTVRLLHSLTMETQNKTSESDSSSDLLTGESVFVFDGLKVDTTKTNEDVMEIKSRSLSSSHRCCLRVQRFFISWYVFDSLQLFKL